jgi:hypothetical protein
MSVPGQEDRLVQLAEDWYGTLVGEGWAKDDVTWMEAKERAREEWKRGYEG